MSLSRPFRQGAAVAALVGEGLLHPNLAERVPADISHLYSHPEHAIRAVAEGRTTLVSTGTGKTECFLYPVKSAGALPSARKPRLPESARSSWFRGRAGAEAQPTRPRLRPVEPPATERYVTCMPFVPLQAVAGAG